MRGSQPCLRAVRVTHPVPPIVPFPRGNRFRQAVQFLDLCRDSWLHSATVKIAYQRVDYVLITIREKLGSGRRDQKSSFTPTIAQIL
jgi:hypothetical protein